MGTQHLQLKQQQVPLASGHALKAPFGAENPWPGPAFTSWESRCYLTQLLICVFLNYQCMGYFSESYQTFYMMSPGPWILIYIETPIIKTKCSHDYLILKMWIPYVARLSLYWSRALIHENQFRNTNVQWNYGGNMFNTVVKQDLIMA